MQPAIALIADGKHDKNKDEGANELEWEMGDRISSMPRSSLEKTEAGSHFIEKAICRRHVGELSRRNPPLSDTN
jgi:hypothetical protein